MAGKEVIYWQKSAKFIKEYGKNRQGQIIVTKRETDFELVSCKAEVLGTSKAICIACNEPEQGHGKSRRRHGFTPNPNVGLSLRVTYVGNPGAGQTVELQNVLQGKEAGCYTEVK